MSNLKRRLLLKATLASGAVGIAVGAGLVTPGRVLAAWPKSAFNAKSVKDALTDLYKSDATVESADIKIEAPQIAENGAVVPVSVKTSLSDVESITVIVEGNSRPLAAEYLFTPTVRPMVASRFKIAKSSKLKAVVKSGGKLYSAEQLVKVTVGGCGG